MAQTTLRSDGWYQVNTEGIGSVYLSIVDEGLVTQSTDSPASTAFRPRIVSPELFSIKRRPQVWVWGSTNSIQSAAFGQLRIDNYDGAFNFLLASDLRDTQVIIKLTPQQAFGDASTVNDSPTVATAIIEDISSDEEDVITITLKDSITRLDRPLPMRFNPPFVDQSAADRMVPLSLGACRNVAPLLIDQANRIYQLHDASVTNLTAVRDMGALLDVHASPPQVAPALNNSGIQLQTLPVGKLTADFSSQGTQTAIPGAADVLNGVGRLLSTASGGVTTWTGTPATTPPSNWSYQNTAYGTFYRYTAANGYGADWAMGISTNRAYNPPSSDFGCPAYITTPFLLPGRTYRISITIERGFPPSGWYINDGSWGIMLRTDLTRSSSGDVSGSAWGPYLTAPELGRANYSFIYTCPNDGVTRTLYVIGVGKGASYGVCGCAFRELKAELLGQYIDLPMVGISLTNYFTEVLNIRGGEPTTAWNASDLAAIDGATNYLFGNHYDTQPTIAAAASAPLDSFCATMFTDANGVIRVRRLIDPKTAAPVATFDLTNTQRPISIYPDRARYLTTVFGARRNWSEYSTSDFVTDYVAVPADVRERYKRTSQFQVVAARSPAGQYNAAVGAAAFDTLLDAKEDAQREVDRVVGIYSPTVYADGTVFNGKRRFVQFTVFFDDIAHVDGQSMSPGAHELLFGDVVTLNYPQRGFNNTPVMVAGTELFPFAKKLVIWGFV